MMSGTKYVLLYVFKHTVLLLPTPLCYIRCGSGAAVALCTQLATYYSTVCTSKLSYCPTTALIIAVYKLGYLKSCVAHPSSFLRISMVGMGMRRASLSHTDDDLFVQLSAFLTFVTARCYWSTCTTFIFSFFSKKRSYATKQRQQSNHLLSFAAPYLCCLFEPQRLRARQQQPHSASTVGRCARRSAPKNITQKRLKARDGFKTRQLRLVCCHQYLRFEFLSGAFVVFSPHIAVIFVSKLTTSRFSPRFFFIANI